MASLTAFSEFFRDQEIKIDLEESKLIWRNQISHYEILCMYCITYIIYVIVYYM